MTALSDFLDDQAAQAVITYMNDEQAQSCLFIAQAHSNVPPNADVQMIAINRESVDFHTTSASAASIVSVPWIRPVSTRGEVRTALMDLLEDALTHLST